VGVWKLHGLATTIRAEKAIRVIEAVSALEYLEVEATIDGRRYTGYIFDGDEPELIDRAAAIGAYMCFCTHRDFTPNLG
jgi:hypothetical protein